MRIDRMCLGVRHVAEDKTSRYALGSVALQRQDGHSVAVGCDASLLVAAETVGEDRDDDGIEGACLIALDTAKALYQAIPKRGEALVACEDHKFGYLVPKSKGGPVQEVAARPEGTYPKWEGMLPWQTAIAPQSKIILNGKLLAKLARALGDFYEGDSRGGYQHVELSLPKNPEAPVMIRARRNDGRVMFGAIMPMRYEEAWPITDTERAFGAK